MFIRRSIVPLICLGLMGYLGYHMLVGERGLESRARLESDVRILDGELKGLQAVRQRLDRDVALMRADKLDPDMLDERARTILNFSHPDEIVIMNKAPAPASKP